MKLLIRDDDISSFTDWKILDSLYKDIYGIAEVAFAVIPKVGNVKHAIPVSVSSTDFPHDFSDNPQLVKYITKLAKQNLVKIFQHGATHLDNQFGYELESQHEDELYANLLDGKKLLEETFDQEIDSLVAPHDRFSRQAIAAIERIGYRNIYRLLMPLPREIKIELGWLANYTKLVGYYLLHPQPSRYPWPIQLGKHTEIYCYRIEELMQSPTSLAFGTHLPKDGSFTITTHHMTMDAEKQRFLKELVSTCSSS